MTELRKAAEMALDALEEIGDEWGFTSERIVPNRTKAIQALRQALADEAMAHVWQKKKQWVGLSDEDKDSFWRADQMTSEEWDELFAAVEAKLKEKNGG
jgi:hypothetical protein